MPMNTPVTPPLELTRNKLARKIAFAHYSAINIGTAKRFEQVGLGPDRFFSSDERSIATILRLNPKIVAAMRDPAELKKARAEVDFIEDNGITPIWYTDPEYPPLLRECQDAPAMLFRLGKPMKEDCKVISVVGTRHCTPYGLSFIDRFIADIAESLSNVIIISGLAFGADIAAHRAAIKNGVPTGAVMAEGLNRIYPAEHRSDAVRIVREGGFLLTRYLSSDTTHKGHFLSRNRIVAGMADVTVIVESDIKGGAMVTARLAADYHREVLALPGRISDRYSNGCNELIFRNEARIVRDAGDLIEAMCWIPDRQAGIQTTLQPQLSRNQMDIMHLLQAHQDATINDLAIALNLPVAEISSLLFNLEMDGFVNAVAGGRYMVVIPV